MLMTNSDEGDSMANRYLRINTRIFLTASARVENIEHIKNWDTNPLIGSVTFGSLFAAQKTTKNTDMKFWNCH